MIFTVTVDFYDPYPETSGGLVRPYELFSFSKNPIDWFEFGLKISLLLYVKFEVRIKVWGVKIILYEFYEEHEEVLLDLGPFAPGATKRIVECGADGTMLLKNPTDSEELKCIGLGGGGAETIECNKGDAIMTCRNVESVQAEQSSASTNIVLFGIQSEVDLSGFTMMATLKLDYRRSGGTIIADGLITIDGTGSQLGTFRNIFSNPPNAVFIDFPEPENDDLETSIGADCNTVWNLNGYSNLVVYALDIMSGCLITATGGLKRATLVLDFTPFWNTNSCSNGSQIVTVEKDGDNTKFTVENPTSTNTILVGSNFKNFILDMSDCNDVVNIMNMTSEQAGSVSVNLNDGDDQITIGNGLFSLTNSIKKNVYVYGGDGQDTIIVNDGLFGPTTRQGLLNAYALQKLTGSASNSINFEEMEHVRLNLSGKASYNDLTVATTPEDSSTTISVVGASSMDPFANVINVFDSQGDLTIEAGYGDNHIAVYNVEGGLTATAMGGDNIITVEDVRDDVVMAAGAGSDTITISNTGGSLTLNAGGGDNTILIDDTVGAINNLESGDGEDTITISNTGGSLFMDTGSTNMAAGAGSDTITISNTGANTGGSLTLNAGGGNNTISIDDTVGAIDSLTSGDGEDIITVHETRGNITLMSGGGDDNLLIYDSYGQSITVYAGAGNDDINFTGMAENLLANFYGDEGNDRIDFDGRGGTNDGTVNTFDGSTLRWSGGDGRDTAKIIFTSFGTTTYELFEDTLDENKLIVECADFDCNLLSRENFLANIHDVDNPQSTVERIQIERIRVDGDGACTTDEELYDCSKDCWTPTAEIPSGISLFLNGGNNSAFFDDTIAPFDVNGGPENDGKFIVKYDCFGLILCRGSRT